MNLTLQVSTTSIVRRYLGDLSNTIKGIDVEKLACCAEMIVSALFGGKSLYIAGNGGSAATSIHMAADWQSATARFSPRPRVVALAGNIARVTAIANDLSYENIFSEQLGEGQPGDVLLLLSVSGDSPNLILAAKEAQRRGMIVVSE